MSQYDALARQVARAKRPITLASGICFIVCGALSLYCLPHHDLPTLLFGSMILSAAGGLVLVRFSMTVLPPLRKQRSLVSALKVQMQALAAAMGDIHRQVPPRGRGVQFKKAYALEGKPIPAFEFLLSSGMHKEGSEVWVSAFCREGRVLLVFASIGSPNRCRPNENILRYPDHVARLCCDELRQYHNHPVRTNETSPSDPDIHTSRYLASLLAGTGCRSRSFIVFWNAIGEHRILEHDDSGSVVHVTEFDVSLGSFCDSQA